MFVSAHPGTCHWFFEASPEHSATSPGYNFVAHHSVYGSAPQAPPLFFNWSPDWQSWGTVLQSPPSNTNVCTEGDPWTATSGYTGLNYLSYMARNGCITGANAISAGATQDAGLANTALWNYNEDFVNPLNEARDGEAIAYGGGTPYNCSAQGNQICHCGAASACGSSCMRYVPRVHMATKFDSGSGKTYLYVAYDFVNTSISPQRFRAKLQIFDVTNETNPILVKTYLGPVNRAGTQSTFHSVVSANFWTNNVGWFYYRNSGTDCSTTFEGAVDSNLMLTTSTPVIVQGTAFPSFNIGDYIDVIKRGLPGGYLYPTWQQPVTDATACFSCNGVSYNSRIMGARVLP